MSVPEPFRFSPGDLAAVELVELSRDVYTTPLLSPAGAERLLAEIDARRAAGMANERPPNSMHDHGAMLGPLGLDAAVDQLRETLAPELARRYAHVGGDTLDGHHAYLVEYGRDLDADLGFHVDDSEVTLNVCLGDSFAGSELVLLGRRCALHRQGPVVAAETLEVEHEPGHCVIHLGAHRHRVDPILRGTRRNLIAWLRSSTFRGGEGGPPTEACGPWCDLFLEG
ncbi:MAG: hypothetical protein AAGA20_09485 [Planctomycetota bacterium]